MDRENHFLPDLIASAAAWDDETLCTLASRGLLRRAQKEIEGGLVVAMESPEAEQAVFRAGDFKVTLTRSGLAKARCSCPAPGCCQHILAVALHLREKAAQSPASSTETQDDAALNFWQNFSEADGLRWLGSAALRSASSELPQQQITREVLARTIRISCLPSGVRCQFGAEGSDGVILLSQGLLPKETALALALLALWQELGRMLEKIPTLAVAKVPASLTDKKAFLESVQALLETILNRGLVQTSSGLTDQVAGLSVVADSIPFPRLANALRSVASEAQGLAKGLTGAEPARLLYRLATAYALTEALLGTHPNHPVNLIGENRRSYRALASLDLHAVSAYPWRVPSGYAGVTVLFWSNELLEWFTYSEARPERYGEPFDPIRRFEGMSPWQGNHSLRELSVSHCKLLQPKCSRERRLSSSAQTQVLIVGTTEQVQLKFGPRLFTDWQALKTHVEEAHVVGLNEAPRDANLMVLQPERWGERKFDAVAQVFRWALRDSSGHAVILELGYQELTKDAIARLEQIDSEALQNALLIGHVRLHHSHLVIEPISILRSGSASPQVWSFLFEEKARPANSLVPTLPAVEKTDEEDDEAPQTPEEILEEISRLAPFKGLLLSYAERGLSSLTELHLTALRQTTAKLETAGLTLFSKALADIQPASPRLSRRFLVILHLLQLHEQMKPIM